MSDQLDMFQASIGRLNKLADEINSGRYPDAAGQKGGHDTGLAAAKDITAKLPRLQRRVLEAIRQRPSTPDEIAAFLGLSVLTVRPRVSELKAKKLIVDTGARRMNQSQKNAIVWRAAKQGERHGQ